MKHYTNLIIRKNYIHYLIPAILVSVGNTLQQFVDTVVVSNFLGSYAMTVENYAGPLVQFISFVVYLVGVGGAVVFSRKVGEMNHPKAEQIFHDSMILAVGMGLVVSVLGFIFIDELALFLGAEKELLPYLKAYLVPTLVMIPLSIFVNTLGTFLSPMGYPRVTSATLISANVINLILDVVYIKCFHTDVDGAQWATVSGYVVALIGLFTYLYRKKIRFPSFRMKIDFPLLRDGLLSGITPSLSQLGLIIYYGYFNRMITRTGGSSVMTVFSLCLQILAIFSIVSQGVCSTLRTFIGVYNGDGDMRSIRYILKTSSLIMLVWGGLLFLFVQLGPEMLFDLYNIREERQLASGAVVLYSWIVLFKGQNLIGRDYYNVTKHSFLSAMIALIEGSVGVIILGTVLNHFFGLGGIWISFPINSLIMLIFIEIKMYCDGVWSSKNDPEREHKAYCTLPMDNPDIEKMNETVEECARSLSLDRKITDHLVLIAEETYIFTKEKSDRIDCIDVLFRRADDKVIMLIRSLGKAFNAVGMAKEEDSINLVILNKLPDSVEYEYEIGMNTVRLEFNIDGTGS